MKESDLYPPLKKFLESQGYEVKGEIQDCDVVAIRGEEAPVVIELKLNLNLNLLLQAVERLALTANVYIGIPKSCKTFANQQKRVTKLLKMLGIGLLLIDPKKERVEVFWDPSDYQPRKSKHRQTRLLGEFQKRVGDPTPGGSEKTKGIMTAYRQRAIKIAQYLEDEGATKASFIASALKEPEARNILYRDVYGWFDRKSLGIYELSPRGHREFKLWLEKTSDKPNIPSDATEEIN